MGGTSVQVSRGLYVTVMALESAEVAPVVEAPLDDRLMQRIVLNLSVQLRFPCTAY